MSTWLSQQCSLRHVGVEGYALDLNSVHMVNLARPLQTLRAALRQPDILDLALLFQLLELLHGLFDRRLAIETMGVVEVDVRDAQATEGLLAGSTAVLGRGVDSAVALLVDLVGEFGGEEDVIALAWVGLEPLACSVIVSLCELRCEDVWNQSYRGDPRCPGTCRRCPRRARHPGTTCPGP